MGTLSLSPVALNIQPLEPHQRREALDMCDLIFA